jgi:hypothetical protein
MAEGVQVVRVPAKKVAQDAKVIRSANGLAYASYADTKLDDRELERMVQTVPEAVAGALTRITYYFVPLALEDREAGTDASERGGSATMIAAVYTPELAEQAICHRNVSLGETEGVFISTRLLNDRFALSFEFFINVGHDFVDQAGVPESFASLAWAQAIADVRGETSQDSWETRNGSLGRGQANYKAGVNEEAKANFLESAFADAVAIYMLSLSIDFDYSELREREYPLLAPQALAERLRLQSKDAQRLIPGIAHQKFEIKTKII